MAAPIKLYHVIFVRTIDNGNKKTAGIASLFFGGDYEVILPAIVQLD